MDEILFKLLEQTPVVITMGIGLYALWKDGKGKEKAFAKEREEHKAEIKELNSNHAKSIKELNDYIRDSDRENQEAMNQIVLALEAVKLYIKENEK